jgi:antitoxin FitA
MAQTLIRNLDDKVLDTYRRRASENGRSLEAELREVVSKGARLTPAERVALSDRLRAMTAIDGPLSDSTEIIRYYRDTHGGRWTDEADTRHKRSA